MSEQPETVTFEIDGDGDDHHYQQAITAGGMGCKAAMDADVYLEDEAPALAESESENESGTATADD